MKVLFAIKEDDGIIASIERKFKQDSKTKFTYNKVDSLNAIIKELQANSYNRVVVSEDFDDKLKYTKSTKDQAKKNIKKIMNSAGKAKIIFCTNDKSDIKELVDMDVYNIVVGKDKIKKNIYDLLNNPNSKDKAVEMYGLNKAATPAKKEKADTAKSSAVKATKAVSKPETKKVTTATVNDIFTNIKYLNREDLEDEKYVKRFDSLCDKYDKTSLEIIVKSLSPATKKILKKKSIAYNKLLGLTPNIKTESESDNEPKRRGRPRKESSETSDVSKKRGRPRKENEEEEKKEEAKPKKKSNVNVVAVNPIPKIKPKKVEEKESIVEDDDDGLDLEDFIIEDVVEEKKEKKPEKTKPAIDDEDEFELDDEFKIDDDLDDILNDEVEEDNDFDELEDDFDLEDEDEEESTPDTDDTDEDFDLEDEDDDEFDLEDDEDDESTSDIDDSDEDFDLEDEDDEDFDLEDDEDESDDDFDLEDDDEDDISDEDILNFDEDEDEEDVDLEDDDEISDDDILNFEDDDEEDFDLDDEEESEEPEEIDDLEEQEEDEDDDILTFDDESDDDDDILNFDDDDDDESDESETESEKDEDDDILTFDDESDDEDILNFDDEEESEEPKETDDSEEDDDILTFDDESDDDDILNFDDEDEEESEVELDSSDENEEQESEDDDILNFDDESEDDDILNFDEEDDESNEEESSDDDLISLSDDSEDDDIIKLDEDEEPENESIDSDDTLKIEDEGVKPGLGFVGIQNKNYSADNDIAKQINEINDEDDTESTESFEQTYNDEPNNNTNLNITDGQKIVAFVGGHGNGTSFLVNNIASLLSEQGINVAILDVTKNRNSYYIYTENQESLRGVAFSCFDKLNSGISDGIKVNKNLTVYTALPNSDASIENKENAMNTILSNNSLVILDCDVDTDADYFEMAEEIYLVQTLDILTIQPLTSLLKKLKMSKILDESKLRILINKDIKVNELNDRILISALSVYNSPDTTYQLDLFNRDTVQYLTIPFEEKNYCKYLGELARCKLRVSGYSKALINSFNKLAKMIYPIGKKRK